MKQLLTINLTTRTSDWTPPTLTFGESLTLAMRFQKSINGALTEPNLTLSDARASIGQVDARPGGGKFALQFGSDPSTADNTTDEVSHDCTPAALAAAINAKTVVTGLYGTATAKKVDGSWLLRFGTGAAEVPFKVVDNTLWPISFGVVSARQLDGKWVHELRLTQAPVAFVSSTGDLTLPDAPSISVKVHGGSSGAVTWDTVQQLTVPPDFRGSYRIKKGFQRTALLAADAGADEIQAALIAAFGSTFVVTLPFSFVFYIDLGGDFAGLDVAAMEIEAAEAPAGDLLLTLPLDRFELKALLRTEESVTLPLEIRITAAEDGGDPQEIVALYLPVTIQRPVAFPELEETPTIYWLRFPSPKTYVPPGTGNVLTGEKIQVFVEGDGSTTSWPLAHLLNSRDVQVFVRINVDGGLQLVDGTDFTATVDGLSQVTVTSLIGAPGTGAAQWRITVVAAKEIASFAPDLTVTEAQVDGLEDDLAALDARITTLESLLPGTASLPVGTAAADAYTIQLPPASEILFARETTGAPITDVTKLNPRAAYLLPAIHRSSNDGALSDPLPAPTANALYTTAAATLIPGGGHIRSSKSVASGFVGSDGRMNYPVTRSGTTSSYFPTPFERTLFEVMINDMQFSSGTVLTCLFKLALQLLYANSEAQWVLAIEQGLITADTTPGTPDANNLLSVDWQVATPLVLQKINLSSSLETHGFGCTIANSGGTTFTANGLVYKRVLNATSNVQQTANFALRARLLNFDTKDNVTDAKGWLSWALQAPDNGILGVVIA